MIRRQAFCRSGCVLFSVIAILLGAPAAAAGVELRVAPFCVDATPPPGTPLCDALVPPAIGCEDPLFIRGLVLVAAQQEPIVLAAADWIGIGNGGQDRWKQALATAAGTTPDRVCVHALHQHDAPGCDFTAERIAAEAGLGGRLFNRKFAEETMERTASAVEAALGEVEVVTHVGWGSGKVREVASNRRLLGADGKVQYVRYTACPDPAGRALPEGLVDPEAKTIVFWNEDRALAVLTYYATHPQSYYRTGMVSADFVGRARALREEALPDIPHIHFNGAGGNIGAGKYNDGQRKNREILGRRLAAGMQAAWEAADRVPVEELDFAWDTRAVLLPASEALASDERLAKLHDKNASLIERLVAARDLAWLERLEQEIPIVIGRLRLGPLQVIHLPGELFVEYQLAAQSLSPEGFVCTAAYGDYGPGYVGTAIAYTQGGYETSYVSRVSPRTEAVLTRAMQELLVSAPSTEGGQADAREGSPAESPALSPEKSTPASEGNTEPAGDRVLRIGIIGLDTSHAIQFTKIINETLLPEAVGCRVTLAYPQGSLDIESSVSRVPGYIEQVEAMGVSLVDSIESLVDQVDAVLLETNDGRPHLAQALPVLSARKPIFIDKPMAASLADVMAIFDAAEHYRTPVFSTSALRYGKGTLAVHGGAIGKPLGCDTYGSCGLEKTHPDLFWYGIHGVEALFTVMGTGCESVVRCTSPGQEMVVGLWDGGRIGSFRGMRVGAQQYGGVAFGEQGNQEVGTYEGYEPLVADILKFFRGSPSPVSREETEEIFAFMEAADESKRLGGRPVTIAEIRARAEAAAREKRSW
jgi:predicted dehydrogenase